MKMSGREWVRVLLAQDDGIPDMSGFSDDSAEMPEIITLQPGEEIPDEEEKDEVRLSKAEYEALRQGKDSSSALLEGLKGLQDTLAKPGKEAVNVQQKPGESDEEFETRLEKEFWKEGNSAKAIKEAINRYGNTQQLSQLMGVISLQNKQIMEMHPEKGKLFNKYKDEIEGLVGELPAEQQNHPQVWEYALKQIKERHQDDIVQETVEDIVQKRVQEELERLGIGGDNGSGNGDGNRYMATGRSPARTAGKKRVYVSADDQQNAAISGLPVEEYLRKIGKVK